MPCKLPCDVQVVDLKTASTHLSSQTVDPDKVDLLPQLHWAENVLATGNFLSCALSANVMAIHVRVANNMLLFNDHTVLLVSERETEHLLRAIRGLHESEMSACLVNLAACRWTAASVHEAWQDVPLALGALPDPDEGHPEYMHAIAAAQLFSGETEFVCEATAEGADGNAARREAVVESVFGSVEEGGAATAAQAADAVEALVELRGRRQCWPGSDLEAICTDEVTRAKFA